MIGDRYVLGELFNSGAQGEVWKALDKITGAPRIIKTGTGVKKEALLSRSLAHPLIGYPYDFGVDEERGEFAVYPQFAGKSSLEWVREDRKNKNLRLIAAQAAEFLCFLHHRGWLYNDFKPDHFLIAENRLKVIDLGLCTQLKSSGSSSSFSGTFPYIAPERMNGRAFDQRSDIFAF
jgi:eukaryotic-like serine/threonine-protein kinase